MNKYIKLFLKYSMLFSYGGIVYMTLEEIFRQRTAYSMAICGGLAFIIIGCLNNIIPWSMSLVKQCLIGGICVVTPLELIFGLIVNQNHAVWDYREVPLSFFDGQICVPFTILWCFISLIAIVVDDYLRYYIFNEEKPHYKLF